MTPKDEGDVSDYEGVDASISLLKLSRASPSSYLLALGSRSELKTQSRTKYTKHYVVHELGKARDLDEFSGFLQLSLPLHKQFQRFQRDRWRGHSSSQAHICCTRWKLGGHHHFPVSAERQCWAWVGFYVTSDVCLHKDFCLLVLMPKHRV